MAQSVSVAIAEPRAGADHTARGSLPVQLVAPVDLEVCGVSKRFGTAQIIDNVSFSVKRGEAVALIGPNGAGKSTLMRLCLRLVEPDAGDIRIEGTLITTLKPVALRKARSRIGFVFQKHNLSPRLSVLSNVINGALGRAPGPRRWLHGFAPRAVREEAMHCLEQVGLAAFAARRADKLSGGQSQRVAIARMLMQRPHIICADEPVASLDPTAGAEVMDLFTDLICAHGYTLLFSSHHLGHARTYSDRILALKSGRMMIDTTPSSLSEADLMAIYGAPLEH